jgi:uridylate kinase
MNTKETIVMSVGGSLIVPDQIDSSFLIALKTFVEREISAGRRFIIIAGGGKTARRYQEAAGEVTSLTNEDLDWMGIHATRLNGHLLRTIFRDVAHSEMITNPDDIRKVPETDQVVIAAGYRPGSSTDLRAVQIAHKVSAHKVINLSNIDYVYSDDPRTNADAIKLENISWQEFRELIPTDWDPGMSAPFDPIAAKEADEHNIEVAVINGNKPEELTKYLNGETFVGTKIS